MSDIKPTEVTTEIAVVEVATMKPQIVTAFKNLEKKQKAIVKKNPLIEVVTKENYEEAKRRRTALLKASTSLEGEAEVVVKKIKSFMTDIKNKYGDGAKITRDAHALQQTPIKTYEDAVQAEKDRIAAEKEAEDERIQLEIKTISDDLIKKVDAITYETIEAGSQEIEEIITAKSGTFDEFDILFDNNVENIRLRLEEHIAEVNEEFEAAEQNRKDKILQRIKDLRSGTNEVIVKMTFETLEADKTKVLSLLNEEYDYQEFKEDFENAVSELTQLFNESADRIEGAEKTRKEQADKDNELEQLRADSLFNKRAKVLTAAGMTQSEEDVFSHPDLTYGFNRETVLKATEEEFLTGVENTKINIAEAKDKRIYNERSEKLIALGMQADELGDFAYGNVSYRKAHIIDNNEEMFEESLTYIENAIKDYDQNNPEPSQEIDNDYDGSDPGDEHTPGEQSETIVPVEEPTPDEESEKYFTSRGVLGDVVKTLGDFRKQTAHLTDETPLTLVMEAEDLPAGLVFDYTSECLFYNED